MNRCMRTLSCISTVAVFALLSADATARPSHKPHAQQAHEAGKKTKITSKATKEARSVHRVAPGKRGTSKQASAPRKVKPSKSPAPKQIVAPKEAVPPLTGDLALVKEAIDLARKAKTQEATDTRNRLADPAAQKLVEWYILRHPDTVASFSRYATFLAANPEWPSTAQLRRRAEARLWEQRVDAATVRGFTGDQPVSAKGKLALARVLLADGDRDRAATLAREAWRTDDLSERLETDVLETFRDLITRDDHRARMDRRIGAKDLTGAKRAAQRLGDNELAIVKACAAVKGKDDKAMQALDDVAVEARQDLGYTLCRIQWMVAKDRIDDAARLIVAALPETMAWQDTDQWWRERRSLARKLLDQGKFQTAYDVVSPAASPANEYYRADVHFMSGWIALRYLDDPRTAAAHFARIDDGAANPTVLSRANYWARTRGRGPRPGGCDADQL